DTGREREHYRLVYGAELRVAEGDRVKPGQLMAEWDPFATPILTEVSGQVSYGDLVEQVTFTEKVDEVTGLSRKVVMESKAALHPRISIRGPEPGGVDRRPDPAELQARYLLPVGAKRVVQHRQSVESGDLPTRTRRDTTKVQDIAGGLPRVAELFEARK